MYNVIRIFGADYILFDLIFLLTFISLLLKYRKKIPLWAFFVGGLGINFVMDWGIWLHTGIREISGLSSSLAILFFFLWFSLSLSYGVEYAYVFLMFEDSPKMERLKWTLLVLGGWLLVAFLSQLIPLNDTLITTNRHMFDLRLVRIGIVLIGYSLLAFLGYNWKKITYLFFVGFLIHFMMEFSLLISGIRPQSFLILLENSLIEFNMGVPFFYLLYDKLLKKQRTEIEKLKNRKT